MANQVITATEANRHLSDILGKVQYQQQSFNIKRGKEIIAKLIPATSAGIPISELNDFVKCLPPLTNEDRSGMEQILKELRSTKPDIDAWD